MSKQTITIIDFDILYKILDEIKENLSFNIVYYATKNDFFNNDKINIKNSLIITTLNNHKFFKKINLLNFNNFPVSLDKLIETVNIHLLKLKFNHQSKIIMSNYELDLNSKFLSKNNLKLKVTEKEIEIILYLFSNKTKHDVRDLQKNIWGYSVELETHTVETHIYRLRKKIHDKFDDQNFILSHKDGYYVE
mgnify:FL=1|jgi:hypothetical protein|tara:strand:+ start:230 stop:805 length:576 start_codon:yes stop_codon:yes gene_type:complete